MDYVLVDAYAGQCHPVQEELCESTEYELKIESYEGHYSM